MSPRWPQVLRVMAMALAALSVAWGIALPGGVVAAAVGAAVGVVVGQRLGRSSLRLWAVLAGIMAAVVGAHLLARVAVSTSLLPVHLGPGRTLRLASVLRFGSATLGVAAALRSVAVRRPVAVGFELAVVAAAIPLSFTSHRDGVIARPLWLGDWAWARGIDPAVALLAVGGVAVAALALLLLAEGRSRRAPSAFLALALLTALAVVLLRKVGLPNPDPLGSLGPDGGVSDGGGEDASADGGDGGKRRRGRRDGGAADGGESAEPSEGDDGGDGTPEDGGGDDGGGMAEVPPDLDKVNGPPSGQDTPMAVVILDEDYSPPSQGYYFREEAWSQLNGPRLVRATRSDVDGDVPDSFPIGATAVLGAPHPEGRALLHTTVALLVDHPRPFAIESPTLLAPAQNPNPARFKRAYRATSLAQSAPYAQLTGGHAGDPAWSPEVRAHYLAVPDDPRYGAFAREIVAHMPARTREDPFAQAVRVKLRLDDAFSYSTQHKHAGAADPTADFLFGDRIGYCVHFAHAAVYLWRSLGIPARVGAGYHVDEDARHGGSSILVRGRDAHAWPELYLEGYGWIVLDIAAKRNLDPPATPVDTELQRMLGEMARSLPPDPEDTGTGVPSGLLPAIAWGLAALLGLGAVLLYVVKVWRRLAPRFAGAEALPWVGYRGALDMLSEVGQQRGFGESREAFAERVRAVAPSFAALTALHLRAALGVRGAPAADPAGEAWRGGLAALRQEIGAAAPLGRRILGALNPASFLGSR
jgi:transglutaminase-like putative cysteine protease